MLSSTCMYIILRRISITRRFLSKQVAALSRERDRPPRRATNRSRFTVNTLLRLTSADSVPPVVAGVDSELRSRWRLDLRLLEIRLGHNTWLLRHPTLLQISPGSVVPEDGREERRRRTYPIRRTERGETRTPQRCLLMMRTETKETTFEALPDRHEQQFSV